MDAITDLGAHLAGVFPPTHTQLAAQHVLGQPRVEGLRHHQAWGGRGEGGGGLRSPVSSGSEILHGVNLHLSLEGTMLQSDRITVSLLTSMFQGLAVVFQYWDSHWWAWWASRGSWAATAPTPPPPPFLSDHNTPDFCNNNNTQSGGILQDISPLFCRTSVLFYGIFYQIIWRYKLSSY